MQTERKSALNAAERAGDAECQAQALSGLADAQYMQGRMLTALGYFQRCVDLCEQTDLLRYEIPNRAMVAHCLQYEIALTKAITECRRSSDDAARIGLVQAEILARESLRHVARYGRPLRSG